MTNAFKTLVGALPALCLAAPILADDSVATLNDLDQRLRIAERKLELESRPPFPKLSGVLQVDARSFFDDQLKPGLNEVLVRRARLQVDPQVGERLKIRLQAELAGASATLVDAYADLKLDGGFTARFGRFKTPLSLERWRSDPDRDLIELGLTSGLVTDRDQGLLLEWSDANGVTLLQGGVVNGGLDGASPSNDNEDDKDAVGRVFFHPFRLLESPALANIGVGWSASGGHRLDQAASNVYRSPGQATVFSYNAGAQLNGQAWRIGPQAYAYWRSLGLLGELVKSEFQIVRPGIPTAASTFLHHDAFQVQGLWVLTGEDASFKGVKLGPESGAFGSLALVGRYEELRLDSGTFDRVGEPRFASLTASISRAASWSAGFSYIPLPGARFLLHWTETRFSDGSSLAGRQADRETERVLFARAQFNF